MDDATYHEYLTSTKGPKKVIDYSKLNQDLVDYEDLSSFDIGSTQVSAQLTEEQQLAEALRQIQEMESQELIKVAPTTESIDQMLQQGEFVYELYAILIHNGGAFGGHYFAYIKSPTLKDEWHNFNDSSVKPISDAELMNTFGGEGQPNTAYMLMYRKVNQKLDCKEVPQQFIDQN